MTWKYNDEDLTEIPEGMEGFVYLITNLTNNRKYIGKKHFWSRQKDKKTGRRKKKESDWKNYFGSCDELTKDVKEIGKENFLREILYICAHKKTMSYYETYEQFKRDVLLTDEYYNTNIEGKFFVNERRGIFEIALRNDKYREDKRKLMTGENNPAKRPEVRKKLSELHSGEGNPMYGVKLSSKHKKALTTSKNIKISDGKTIWNSVTSYLKDKKIGFLKYKKQLENGLIFVV